ncbi:HET-domain-containing protein, partial [Periconia macrospinosa]
MEQPAPSTEYQPPLPPRETDESLTYNHEPLNPNKREIRLLEVLPGNDGDTIQCHLRVVNFADHPVYTALSYTWSNGNRSIHHIWIDGKMLQFGNNLWLFLQEFRKRKATDGVLLWVDAICIEQSNIQERNHQVAQMRDIYSTASSVIVWLGPCLDDDAHAFDLLRYSRRLLSIPKNQDPRRYRSHRQWNALASVFSKAYWERAWVIQEFL